MTFSIQAAGFWHPSGMRFDSSGVPGVSLRSTPGYGLRSLRDEIQGAAERVETFHGGCHYLRSLCEGIPNPEGCQNVAGGRSIPRTSGHRTDMICNPEGCQNVVGGRSIPQTSGHRTDMICNPEGCQNVAGGRSIAQTSGHRITQDPHPCGVPERRMI